MTELLGLPVDDALAVLAGRGIADARVTLVSAPGKAPGRGRPRVIRVDDSGRALIAARFPDEVETNIEEHAD